MISNADYSVTREASELPEDHESVVNEPAPLIEGPFAPEGAIFAMREVTLDEVAEIYPPRFLGWLDAALNDAVAKAVRAADRAIHFPARSAGQRRRWQREREERARLMQFVDTSDISLPINDIPKTLEFLRGAIHE